MACLTMLKLTGATRVARSALGHTTTRPLSHTATRPLSHTAGRHFGHVATGQQVRLAPTRHELGHTADKRAFGHTAASSAAELSDRQRQLMSRNLPKKRRLPGVGHVILVASGKGGVGKSTTAVNLALALSASEWRTQTQTSPTVGLLDADVFGPSIPLMLGLNEQPVLNEQDKMVPLAQYGLKCMSMGFLVDPKSAAVWRGPMVMGAVEKLVHGTAWGPLDVLVVDLPPGTGDIHLSLAQTLDVRGAVIVTTPQKVALADARKGVDMFHKVSIPVLGVVENMSGFACAKCGHTTHVFGRKGAALLAEEKSVELLGGVPLDPEVMASADDGRPIVLQSPRAKATLVYKEVAGKILRQLERTP